MSDKDDEEEDEKSCDSGGRGRRREVAGGETDAPALLVMLAVAELPVYVTDGGGEHPSSSPQSVTCPPNPPTHIVLALPCAIPFSTTPQALIPPQLSVLSFHHTVTDKRTKRRHQHAEPAKALKVRDRTCSSEAVNI